LRTGRAIRFFHQAQFQRLFGSNLLQARASRRRSVTSLLVAARAVSPASRAPLAGFQELLRPAVIETFGDAFPTAQLGNTALPSQAVQTMRIFSSAEYCLRVARRMFFTRRPDEEVGVLEFCLTSFP